MKNKTLSYSEFKIPADHPSLSGHFPGNPVVPAVVILDTLTSYWQRYYNKNISQLAQAKFVRILKPDVQCLLEFKETREGVIQFSLSELNNPGETICKGVFHYDH